MDIIYDRGPPASQVEAHVLSEVLTSSPRLASQGWIIFKDPRSSCLSIHLRGSCHEADISFDGIPPVYLRGCTIEDHLRRSSSSSRLGGAPVLTWRSFPIGIGGLCSYLMFLEDSAPEATFADENHLQQLL